MKRGILFPFFTISLADMNPKGKVDTLKGEIVFLKEVIILRQSRTGVRVEENQIDPKQIYTTGYIKYIERRKKKSI